MKIIFVSAPYRIANVLDKTAQIAHIEEVTAAIVLMGALPIAAHTNSRCHENIQTGEWWMAAYGTLLQRCDATYFDVGWESSVGCRFEHDLAGLHDKPKLFSLTAVKEWLAANT